MMVCTFSLERTNPVVGSCFSQLYRATRQLHLNRDPLLPLLCRCRLQAVRSSPIQQHRTISSL